MLIKYYIKLGTIENSIRKFYEYKFNKKMLVYVKLEKWSTNVSYISIEMNRQTYF